MKTGYESVMLRHILHLRSVGHAPSHVKSRYAVIHAQFRLFYLGHLRQYFSKTYFPNFMLIAWILLKLYTNETSKLASGDFLVTLAPGLPLGLTLWRSNCRPPFIIRGHCGAKMQRYQERMPALSRPWAPMLSPRAACKWETTLVKTRESHNHAL